MSSEFFLNKHYSNPANTIELVAISLIPGVRANLIREVVKAHEKCKHHIAEERMKTMKKIVAEHFPMEIFGIAPKDLKEGKGNKVIVIEESAIADTATIREILGRTGAVSPDYIIGDVALGIRGHYLECTYADDNMVIRRNHEKMPFGSFWHQDTTDTSIYSILVNDVKSPTGFIDMALMYSKLPQGLREKIFLDTTKIKRGSMGEVDIKYMNLLGAEPEEFDRKARDYYRNNGERKIFTSEELERDFKIWRECEALCGFKYPVKSGDMLIWPNRGKIFHRSYESKGINEIGEDDVVRAAIFTGGQRHR